MVRTMVRVSSAAMAGPGSAAMAGPGSAAMAGPGRAGRPTAPGAPLRAAPAGAGAPPPVLAGAGAARRAGSLVASVGRWGARTAPGARSRRTTSAHHCRPSSASSSHRRAWQAPSPLERSEPTAVTSWAARASRSRASAYCRGLQVTGVRSRVSVRRVTADSPTPEPARSRKRRKSSLAVPVSASMETPTTSWVAGRGRPSGAVAGVTLTGASEKATRRGWVGVPNRVVARAAQGPSGRAPSRAWAALRACSRMSPVITVPRTTGRPSPPLSMTASTPPATPAPVATPQSEVRVRRRMRSVLGSGVTGPPVRSLRWCAPDRPRVRRPAWPSRPPSGRTLEGGR